MSATAALPPMASIVSTISWRTGEINASSAAPYEATRTQRVARPLLDAAERGLQITRLRHVREPGMVGAGTRHLDDLQRAVRVERRAPQHVEELLLADQTGARTAQQDPAGLDRGERELV